MEAKLQDLETLGFSVLDSFLSLEENEALWAHLEMLKTNELLTKASVGKERFLSSRGDFIFWIDATTSSTLPFLEPKLVALRQELNQRFFLNLKSQEFHLAYYPPGTCYEKHRDKFRNDDARTVSFVHYLNKGWAPHFEGQLKLFLEDGRERLVEPIFGRSILFLSDLYHEVLPTKSDRYSLTGWFKRCV